MSKVQEAKELLGQNWVGHPNYIPRPRHSTNPCSYIPARQPYLRAVALAAEADRLRNKFFNR